MASNVLKHCSIPYSTLSKYLLLTLPANPNCKQTIYYKLLPSSSCTFSTRPETLNSNENWKEAKENTRNTQKRFNVKASDQSQLEKKWINEEKSVGRLFELSSPDTFGSLDIKRTKQYTQDNILDSFPEEDGDIIRQNYIDEKSQRKRLPLKKYAEIIRNLIQQKKVKEAIDVLEVRMLKEERAKPDYYIYNLLIRGCGHAGYTKKAFELFNNMKKRGLRPTPATYTSLFNSCANGPFPDYSLKMAKHLKELMDEKSMYIGVITYHAMIKAFGRCNDISTAFCLVDEMIEKRLPLSSDTMNFLLQACISEKDAGFRYALLVWQKLRRKWLKPSVFSYNLFLRTIRECGIGDVETFKEVVDQITSTKTISPTEHKYLSMSREKKLIEGPEGETYEENSCSNSHATELLTSSVKNEPSISSDDVSDQINTLAIVEDRPNLLCYKPHLGSIMDVGDVKTAQDRLILVGGLHGILQEMKSDGLNPTISTFGLLLNIIPNTLTAEKALLATMKKYDIDFSLEFFNILIKKRSLRFDYENARAVLKLMQQHQLVPDIMTFGALALSCKRKYEAEDLLESLEEAGFRVNIEILGSMLRQACCNYSFGYIVFLLKFVEKEGFSPNKLFLKHVGDFYANCIDGFKKMHKGESTNIPDFFKNSQFQEGFTMFQKFYKYWLKSVKIEPELHPWEPFKKKKSKKDHSDGEVVDQ